MASKAELEDLLKVWKDTFNKNVAEHTKYFLMFTKFYQELREKWRTALDQEQDNDEARIAELAEVGYQYIIIKVLEQRLRMNYDENASP